MSGFLCEVVPVNDECGAPAEVVGLPYPVPLPAVLDVDYRTGLIYRVRMDLGPTGYGLRALRVTVDETVADVTGQTLRRVRVAELVGHVARYLRHAADGSRAAGELAGEELWDLPAPQRDLLDETNLPSVTLGPDGPHVPEDELSRLRRLGPSDRHTANTVAAVYRLAEQGGRAPVRFVQELLQLPPRTASHWVKVARDVGALGPSKRKPRTTTGADRGND